MKMLQGISNFALVLSIGSISSNLQGQVWERTYGAHGIDRLGGLVSTMDGGAVVVGSTGSFGPGGGDIYLFRVNDAGTQLWSRTIGSSNVEEGVSIAVNSAGQYLIGANVGSSTLGGYDVQLTALNNTGDIQWQRTYGGADWQFCNEVAATDFGWVFVGRNYSGSANGSAWVVAIDNVGDTLWTYEMAAPLGAEARSVIAMTGGTILVAGRQVNSSVDTDGFVSSLTGNGSVNWTTFIGGDSVEVINGLSMSTTGEILCTGEGNSAGSNVQILVARLDLGGGVLMENTIGFNQNICGDDIAESWSGGIMCLGRTSPIGSTSTDYYLLFTDLSGNFQLGRTYGGPGDDAGIDLAVNLDGSLYLAGNTDSYGPGVASIMLIRSDSSGMSSGTVVEGFDPLNVQFQGQLDDEFVVYPSVARHGQSLTITNLPNQEWQLHIVDMTGRPVWSGLRKGTEYTIPVPLCEVGPYMLVVSGEGRVRTKLFQIH